MSLKTKKKHTQHNTTHTAQHHTQQNNAHPVAHPVCLYHWNDDGRRWYECSKPLRREIEIEIKDANQKTAVTFCLPLSPPPPPSKKKTPEGGERGGGIFRRLYLYLPRCTSLHHVTSTIRDGTYVPSTQAKIFSFSNEKKSSNRYTSKHHQHPP